jgi:hypothetical protein
MLEQICAELHKIDWNGIHSALVRINEELLERKVVAPVYKTEINDLGDPPR